MKYAIPKGVIVSVQVPGLRAAEIAAICRLAVAGGAVGLRVNGPVNVAEVRASLPDTPIIGLWKINLPKGGYTITPDISAAIDIRRNGADYVAVDGCNDSGYPRILTISQTGIRVIADVDCASAGLACASEGACAITTALSGYTSGPKPTLATPPDNPLLQGLKEALKSKAAIIAEGRYWKREDVQIAAKFADNLCVGTAVTRPDVLTAQFSEWFNGQQ